jgi:hypothetical protein
MNMDLLERYLAAVAHHLPECKQADVTRELRANILDQLDAAREDSRDISDDTLLREVLIEFGPPRAIADRFHPSPPLILPEYLPIYQWTLILFLGVLFLIQVAQSSVLWLSSDSMSVLRLLKSVASGFIEDGSVAFAVISLAFWLSSQRVATARTEPTERWNPDRLPPLTQNWQRISLPAIFMDLGTNLFLLLLIWYPLWAGIPTALQITETGRWLLQLFSPLLMLGMGLSLWQLGQRVWTPALLKADLALNAMLTIAIIILAFSGPLVDNVPARLTVSITATLLIVALFPAWEGLRDLRRLLRRAS